MFLVCFFFEPQMNEQTEDSCVFFYIHAVHTVHTYIIIYLPKNTRSLTIKFVLFFLLYWTVCHKQKVVLLMRQFKNHMKQNQSPVATTGTDREINDGIHFQKVNMPLSASAYKHGVQRIMVLISHRNKIFLKTEQTAFYLHGMISEQRGEKPKLLQICVSRSELAPDNFFDILIIFYNQPI